MCRGQWKCRVPNSKISKNFKTVKAGHHAMYGVLLRPRPCAMAQVSHPWSWPVEQPPVDCISFACYTPPSDNCSFHLRNHSFLCMWLGGTVYPGLSMWSCSGQWEHCILLVMIGSGMGPWPKHNQWEPYLRKVFFLLVILSWQEISLEPPWELPTGETLPEVQPVLKHQSWKDGAEGREILATSFK